ncbi:hypothetical protein K449DRAFT_1260 [Hypoxylon sp. EC38]|nr:hypothetical protein K449DRAFT_1260 [Hypoxylon sp. EC38]
MIMALIKRFSVEALFNQGDYYSGSCMLGITTIVCSGVIGGIVPVLPCMYDQSHDRYCGTIGTIRK